MATIRPGNQSALLIVDVQVGVMHGAWDSERVIANICTAVEAARQANLPVIWVQHADDELLHGSPEWLLAPPLLPADTETRIHKNYNSSFEQTPLEEKLAELGITHILLAGASSNWCIRATAYAALERGYDLTLLADAHTTGDMVFQSGLVISAEHIIRELNVVITWLSYPGRVNRALTVKELAF